MKWFLKWLVLIVALGSDFLILLAIVVAFRPFPILTLILCIPTYYAWKKTGGLSNWKPSTIKSFLKNWNEVT